MPLQPCHAATCLVDWRKRRGISQTQAAALFQMDQARYSQIELAKRRPGLLLATRMEVRTKGAVRVIDWHGDEEREAWKAKRATSVEARTAA